MRAVLVAMHHPEKTSLHSILFPIFVKLRRLIGQITATKKDRVRQKNLVWLTN